MNAKSLNQSALKNLAALKNQVKPLKIKDTLTLGLVGGLMGTAAMEASNAILWQRGKSELMFGHMAGSIVMNPLRTKRTPNFILGEIMNLATGGALGILILNVLRKTGKDHYLTKGAFVGILTWESLYNLGQRTGVLRARAHQTQTHYAALVNNLLFGIVTAQTIVSLADPSIFPQSQATAQVRPAQAKPAAAAARPEPAWVPQPQIHPDQVKRVQH